MCQMLILRDHLYITHIILLKINIKSKQVEVAKATLKHEIQKQTKKTRNKKTKQNKKTKN